jgi:hypothetical protein
MHIQRVINFKSEYRNTKRFDRLTALSKVDGQIQISNAQMIEEPRSKLRGYSYGECARYGGSNIVLGLVSPRSCFDHSNLDHSVLFRISNFVLRI